MLPLRVDTSDFTATLRRYVLYSKRELAEIVNQKGFSIAMSASKMTRKADYNKMFHEIGPTAEVMISRNVRFLKRGGIKLGKANTQKVFVTTTRNDKPVPVLALIINAARGEVGAKGLYGAEMRKAIERAWAARAGSIAFLRAGWLKAVAGFANAIGVKKRKSSAGIDKRFAGPIGGARPAIAGEKPYCEFFNAAFRQENTARMTAKEKANRAASIQRGMRFATEGAQAAVAQEVSRMNVHIEQKMQAMTNKIVGRFLR